MTGQQIGSETLTLTTTYPAPVGIYRSMITTGTGGANTLLARDGGNVGIGTGAAVPGNLLTISQTADFPSSGIQITSAVRDPNVAITNTSAAGRDWRIISAGTGSAFPSNLRIYDASAGADRLSIDSAGNITIPGNLTVTGTVTGTTVKGCVFN